MRLMRWRPRSGMTLVELLVALVLFSCFGAIALAQIATTGRSLSALADRAGSQSALWHGRDVIATELRSVAPGSGDLLSVSDSSVRYRGFVASGVVCLTPDTLALELLPDSLASGARPATGMTSVNPGDALLLFDEGVARGSADDRWLSYAVTQVSATAAACRLSPYLDPVLDVGRIGYRVEVAGPVPIPRTVSAGAAVRILRPARLALYRASTTDWYLGWADWNSSLGAWNGIQPVAGGYRPYAAHPWPGGVELGVRDSANAVLPTPGGVPSAARLELTLRTQVLTRGPGGSSALVLQLDSLSTRVGLRNRP